MTDGLEQPKRKRDRKSKKSEDGKLKELVEGSDDEATYGIWGPPSAEERAMKDNQISDLARGVELSEEQMAERAHIAERDRRRGKNAEDAEADEAQKFDRLVERKMSHLLPPRMEGEDPKAIEPSTIFHGESELDYRGRSWTAPPAGTDSAEPNDVEDHQCFVPKKCTGRLTGHNKGVHRVRFFPRTGHLLWRRVGQYLVKRRGHVPSVPVAGGTFGRKGDDHLRIAQFNFRPISKSDEERLSDPKQQLKREWHTDWPHDLSAYGSERNAGCVRQPFPDVRAAAQRLHLPAGR